MWLKAGLITRKRDVTKVYEDERLNELDYEEVCDERFYDAVLCRRILFHRIYMEEIVKEKDKYWNSVLDFNAYIHRTCNHHNWFGYLTIFERIFATCAFVITLCFYNRGNENVNIIKFGHICWKRYFEAFTGEFYEQGGWCQLRKAARSYILPFMFLQAFVRDPENALIEVAAAIKNNYNILRLTYIIGECDTVSKRYVKFVENVYKFNNIRGELVVHEECLYAEYILNELKYLCSPCVL
ncbi:hypothetical protein HNY73_010519 [Argiope bruennichi]|uniref:Uncharacterized protein n=1 Tax=Argiope bruennichi TaxID=94029 RepID=A0A8T0F1D8_ARGBR|nr:hypothetical protein HNY73_010519 [Argiope bruennichi]